MPKVRAGAREGEGYSHQNDALILGDPPDVVVCIVSKLEYVWRERLLVIGYTWRRTCEEQNRGLAQP